MNRVLSKCVAAAVLAVAASAFAADEDPYLTYVKNAPEFKPVKQDPGAWTNRWNTWIYMPWRFQWTIGTGDAGGQFCKGDRTYVFVLQNARVTSSVLGDTTSAGLMTGKLAVDVEFPAAVKDAVDERTGKKLGTGTKFAFEFNAPEAALMSFAGAPPRP